MRRISIGYCIQWIVSFNTLFIGLLLGCFEVMPLTGLRRVAASR